jgi:glucose/arabinose dehydrogenase
MRKIHTLLLLAFALLAFRVNAQIPTGFAMTSFSTGYSSPVNIANAGDSRLFIVQQRGKVFICDSLGAKLATPFLDITSKVSSSGSERGLLGLAFDPNYDLNGYFYVNYTRTGDHATVIARYTRSFSNPNQAVVASEKVLLTIAQPYSNHNGGHLEFGRDGYLYIGMGDGGSAGDPGDRAQNPTNLLGKMLRLDVSHPDSTYVIPASNPFVGSGTTREEIWAIGLRNPWKFSFDRLTGDLWIGDVGQDALEEVDFEPYGDLGGHNYGWKCREGLSPYDMSGCSGTYTDPVSVYPNSGSSGCSITGGKRYRGGRYASMYGTYFMTDYCTGHFWAVYDSASMWVTQQFDDVSDAIGPVAFGENHMGELFVAGISTGIIYRITDTACAVTAIMFTPDSAWVCEGSAIEALPCEGCTYEWWLDGSVVPGADSWELEPTVAGSYQLVVTSPGGCTDTTEEVHVNVGVLPPVDFTGLDSSYCDFDPIDTLVGTPPGGTFWGAGLVEGTNLVNPAVPPAFGGLGEHAILYTYTTALGCTATAVHTTVYNTCVATTPPQPAWNLTVFPNPSEGMVKVSCLDLKGRTVQMEMMNNNGQSVGKWTRTFTAEAEKLDLRDLPAGTYHLSISDGQASQVVTIVLQ